MNRKIINKFLIIYCFILLFILSTYTFALYSTDTYAEGNVTVAKPVLTVDKSDFTVENSTILPGETIEVPFDVENTDETSRNEVNMSYYFELEAEGDLPVYVYVDDPDSGSFCSYDLNSSSFSCTVRNTDNTLGFNTDETHNHTLYISMDEQYCSDECKEAKHSANKSVEITVNLIAEQVMS